MSDFWVTRALMVHLSRNQRHPFTSHTNLTYSDKGSILRWGTMVLSRLYALYSLVEQKGHSGQVPGLSQGRVR